MFNNEPATNPVDATTQMDVENDGATTTVIETGQPTQTATQHGVYASMHAPTQTEHHQNNPAPQAPSVKAANTSKTMGAVRAIGFAEALQTEAARVSPRESIASQILLEEESPPNVIPNNLPYTARPAEGHPVIHIDNPLGRYANMDRAQLTALSEDDTIKAIAMVWGARVTSDVAQSNAKQIGDTIYALSSCRPTVHIPRKEDQAEDAPIAYVLTDLTPEAAEFLLSGFCFSLPDITFFVLPMGIETPLWVCSLRGFWGFDLTAIRNGIIKQLSNDPDFEALVGRLAANTIAMSTNDPKEAVRLTLNTLDVQILHDKRDGNTNDWKVNMYVRPPTTNLSDHLDFRGYMRRQHYTVIRCGTGIPWCPIPCTGCHGVDHMRGLCPFAQIPGWNGSRTKRDINVERTIENRARRQQAYEGPRYNDRFAARDGDFTQGSSRGGYSFRGGRGGFRERRPSGHDF